MNGKISIITITLNSGQYLEETITSVLEQTYKKKEYIVIDGGSTDDTLDIIKKHGSKIDYWISEPDGGIADAMNKGLAVATGDYILFLHSDDYLLDFIVLEKASKYLSAPYDIVMFSIFLERNSKKTLVEPKGLTWWINFKTGVFHQSVFCSKNLFQEIGCFNNQFRIAMDYDFFLRAYRTGAKTRRVSLPLSLMRLVGIGSQKDWPNLRERLNEEQSVHKNNCTSNGIHLLYKIYWCMYLPYKRICHRKK